MQNDCQNPAVQQMITEKVHIKKTVIEKDPQENGGEKWSSKNQQAKKPIIYYGDGHNENGH